MGNIEEYRKEINEIDEQMAELFKQRMAVSRKVAEYKMECGLPVKDENREAQIYAKCAERINDPEIEAYYVNFQKALIGLSCDYQTRLMEGLKVSYSGVEGAYAYMAAKKMFPDAQLISCSNFEPAYNAVVEGKADFAVLPIENSYAGDVGAVMDLAFEGPLHINRLCNLSIEHSLIALPGARIADIKTVVSHPQALMQCDEFIKAHGFETKEYVNTARAAQYVKEQGDPSIAAIASVDTAELFGLEILERKINTADNNTSKFAAFSRVPVPAASLAGKKTGFIIVFSVKNEAGALAMTLNILGAHGFNMRNLKSRPLKGSVFEYYFYIEAEGDIFDNNGENTIRELSVMCEKLRLLGAFEEEG
ncbi:MAG: bifunctional chorismate mutase/prephenate dehydratase [Lachnospiraceae bacterium]|nr:bifunctional chorismate mutase/prephenate dehydratase [Lachnospiraceae bacterium]